MERDREDGTDGIGQRGRDMTEKDGTGQDKTILSHQ